MNAQAECSWDFFSEDPDIMEPEQITGKKEASIPNLAVFNQDLIPVYTTDTGEKVVLGRELHEKLGIKTAYKDWFPRMVEYGKDEGFKERQDFNSLKIERVQKEGNRNVSRKLTDHILSLRMAKHIATIQKTNIGFDIREKLFEIQEMVSKQRIQPVLDSYMIEDPVKRAERWIEEKKMQIALEKENQLLLPKAEGFDRFLDKGHALGIREAAYTLKQKQNQFITFLLLKGFVYRQTGNHKLKAYGDFVDKEGSKYKWFRSIPAKCPDGEERPQLHITPLGLDAFGKMLDEIGDLAEWIKKEEKKNTWKK